MKKKPALLGRAKKIRLLAMDIDGVLTDGSILVLESGEEVKTWHVRDRIGFFMLRRTGEDFRTAWITGRGSRSVENAAEDLKIDALYQKCEDKGRALRETAKRFKLSADQVMFIGDDLVDLPALRWAGLAVCPQDAHEVVKQACHWVTHSRGGEGVFREAVDTVLRAQGLWTDVLAQFESPR